MNVLKVSADIDNDNWLKLYNKLYPSRLYRVWNFIAETEGILQGDFQAMFRVLRYSTRRHDI
jgi:hypothetical protein